MEGMEQWKVQVEQLKVQMEQWLEQGLELVHQIPPIQLYVGVGVLLFTTLLLLLSESFSLSVQFSFFSSVVEYRFL